MKKGEKELLVQKLYQLYQPMRNYLKRFHLAEELDEVLQETMVKAWKEMESLREAEKLEPWVKAIARNEVKRFYNNKKRLQNQLVYLETKELEQAAGFTSMEEQGMYESMLGFTDQELYSMIERLGEPASLIISLHYGYEETYEEIALLLGMNVNTVRTISMRSRKKLKGMIEEANTCGTRNRL